MKFKNQTIVAYDMKDNERLVHMCEDIRMMSEYFDCPISTIQSAIYRKSLIKCRYLIERVIETNE